MTSNATNAEEIAARLTAAITAGDLDGVAALYHDDAVVWRNFDGRELTKAQMLKVISFLGTVKNLRYDDLKVQATPTGFVQQHVLRGRSKNDEPVEAPACLVATIKDDRIQRLDEYIDAKALAPLLT